MKTLEQPAIQAFCLQEVATLEDGVRVAQSAPTLSGRLLRQANMGAHGGR